LSDDEANDVNVAVTVAANVAVTAVALENANPRRAAAHRRRRGHLGKWCVESDYDDGDALSQEGQTRPNASATPHDSGIDLSACASSIGVSTDVATDDGDAVLRTDKKEERYGVDGVFAQPDQTGDRVSGDGFIARTDETSDEAGLTVSLRGRSR
jgi:hypothetical protein